jgi:hypothetical protein
MNMTIRDLDELITHIRLCHRGGDGVGKKFVKYVKPSFDMRTNEIYGMEIDDQVFFCVNENRKRDLKKWVNCWLDDIEDGFDFGKEDPEMVKFYKHLLPISK